MFNVIDEDNGKHIAQLQEDVFNAHFALRNYLASHEDELRDLLRRTFPNAPKSELKKKFFIHPHGGICLDGGVFWYRDGKWSSIIY